MNKRVGVVSDYEVGTGKTGSVLPPYPTKEMKVEIVEYLVQFSKGLIEDNSLGTAKMYAAGKITRDELHSLVDSLRDTLIEAIQNGEV